MKIGELARRAGVRTSAIRYYEDEGLLPAPARVSGQRVYDASALVRLRLIHMAQQAGFTLNEVRTIVRGVGSGRPLSTTWRRLAEGKLAELTAAVARLEAMLRFLEASLHCGCVSAEQCEILAQMDTPVNDPAETAAAKRRPPVRAGSRRASRGTSRRPSPRPR